MIIRGLPPPALTPQASASVGLMLFRSCRATYPTLDFLSAVSHNEDSPVKRFSSACLASLLVALAPSGLHSQTCMGQPGADAGTVQLGGVFGTVDGAKWFGARAYAVSERAFGGVDLGTTSYDAFEGSTLTIGGGAGYRLSLGSTGRSEICPFFNAELGSGPNDIEGSGFDLSSTTMAFGAAWGYRAAQ